MRRGGAEEGLPLALPRSKEKHSRLTNTTMSHLWIPYRSDPEGPTPSIQPSPKHVPAPAGEVNKAGSQSVSARHYSVSGHGSVAHIEDTEQQVCKHSKAEKEAFYLLPTSHNAEFTRQQVCFSWTAMGVTLSLQQKEKNGNVYLRYQPDQAAPANDVSCSMLEAE